MFVLVRVLSTVSKLKHLGVAFYVAIDDTFLTTKASAIIRITIYSTSGTIDEGVTAIKCARWHPACNSNCQNSQPALFEVQAITGKSVGCPRSIDR